MDKIFCRIYVFIYQKKDQIMPQPSKLTTVKIFKDKYEAFKVYGIKSGITLQKLVNRSVYLYLTDETYRKKIDSTVELQVSGSSF